MNTKRKVEDYIGKKVAIECSSEKEWELLLKLTSSERKNHFNVSSNKCFDLEKLGDFWIISSKEDIMENGWTIYPASDFLEEDKPFNVGDLVYLEKHYKHETESRDYSTHLNLNKPLTVKNIKLDTNAFGNKTPEWTVYFVEDSKNYGHPACKFKLWKNTTPEYIEILHEYSSYTKKGRTYKVLSWESQNCWVVCNVKCTGFELGSRLCVDGYYENKSWWRPSTKEAYDLQNETKMLPFPTDKKYFKAVVTKDIHKKDLVTRGNMPELLPKGYQTWFILEGREYKNKVLSKKGYVCPEDNRWKANIPAECFEIVEDKKPFKFEEGKWYSFNWDWYNSNSSVIAKIKNVFEGCINISWRSYLWRENDYGTLDTYLFKDISNIKELSIEQVQPYLPEGHPDKFKIETHGNKTKDFIKSTTSNPQVEIKIKNRNPVVKETIKRRNRLEIKPIKQTIKLKHYV